MSTDCAAVPSSLLPLSPAPAWPTGVPLPDAQRYFLRCIDRHGARWSFFDARNVSRIWIRDKYARFTVLGPHGPSERWLEEPLRVLTERLTPLGFVRVRRSELVNLRFLRLVRRLGLRHRYRLLLELIDGQRVVVSRRLAPALRRVLSQGPAEPPRAHE